MTLENRGGRHTPGPWKFRIYALSDKEVEMARRHGMTPTRLLGNDGSAPVTAGSDDDHKLVARIECQTKFKRGEGYRTECSERDANARLIAAAPDLLEALQAVVRVRDKAAFEQACVAIRKATEG